MASVFIAQKPAYSYIKHFYGGSPGTPLQQDHVRYKNVQETLTAGRSLKHVTCGLMREAARSMQWLTDGERSKGNPYQKGESVSVLV